MLFKIEFNLFLQIAIVRGIYPISFENRFKIRPDGFVSKNLIVVEMMPLNIELWRFCEARKQTA